MGWLIALAIVVGLLVLIVIYDLIQSEHAILRNFPVIGHLRYILEAIGPELRQYIVTDNDEERPFSRDQRRWVYSSAKNTNNYFGFGTDNDVETSPNYLIIKHAAIGLPEAHKGEPNYDPKHNIPCAKVLGSWRERRLAFRPESIIAVSAMSFGSLSSRAVEALNRGCALSSCLHNTGEGGIAPCHDHGGDLIWQLGTGYFGARSSDGNFDMEVLVDRCAKYRVRAIEVKMSQGAKPGRGGVLPGAKVTKEIAEIRGVPLGKDVISPPSHREFHDPDSLIDFAERIADATGLPVGVKAAIGRTDFWEQLALRMKDRDCGPDFLAIDGGEGGTGAAPLVFSDRVALPFKVAFPLIYRIFAEQDLHQKVAFIGSGRLGFPDQALLAMALGCDMVAVAREAMLSIGCIQAQKCHTGHCPAGVATQDRWLMRGLEPTSKAARFANYAVTLRKELLWLCRAIGVEHPAAVTLDDFALVDDRFSSSSGRSHFGYEEGWGLPSASDIEEVLRHVRAGVVA